MTDRIDLTGRWTGVYFYPEDHAWNANDNMSATPFTAELTDTGGVIVGQTVEPNLTFPGRPDIRGVLEGRHDGARLTFAKTPDADHQDHVIYYDGDISPDGGAVTGRWSIPGDWSGEFRMQRRTVGETVAEQVEAHTRA
jgi:hypothetical protein